jgi:hypothetical protein
MNPCPFVPRKRRAEGFKVANVDVPLRMRFRGRAFHLWRRNDLPKRLPAFSRKDELAQRKRQADEPA